MADYTSMLMRILCDCALCFIFIPKVTAGRQCYNYDKSDEPIECEHGCCGPDHEEYCCDITLQIIGSVIGGVLVLAVVMGGVYYCCRKNSKQRQMAGLSTGGGILGRFGVRSNATTHPRQEQRLPNQTVPLHPHRVNMPYGHYNPAYVNAVNVPGDQSGLLASHRIRGPPHVIPTAPRPPPYTLTMSPPPPYYADKIEPPPPSPPVYSPPPTSTCQHGTPSHKLDDYTDTMPPASS